MDRIDLRMSTHRARKRIREAKRKARPELASSDMWVAKDYKNTFDLSYKVNDTLERIHNDDVSEEEFIRRLIFKLLTIIFGNYNRFCFTDLKLPTNLWLFRGLSTLGRPSKFDDIQMMECRLFTYNSLARNKWTLERLAKKYRNQKFKCGEDDEGYSVKLKMKYYVDYIK